MKNSAIRLSFCVLAVTLLSAAAQAQTGASGSIFPGGMLGSPQGSAGPFGADATQTSADTGEAQAGARGIVIKPRIQLTETWSDNVMLSVGQQGKQGGLISELTPGIHIDARTARLKAYLDYALTGQYYTAPSGYSRTLNALNALGTLEAVSDWLFIDFSGLIAQQPISAFGPQSPSTSNINSNITETSTYRVSPYIRGNLGGTVDYHLRYNRSMTQANAGIASDIDLSEWAGQLRGGTPFQNLRWAFDASQQIADYSLGRTTEAQRASLMGTYSLDPQFRISLSGGKESNNYISLDQQTHNTYGYGFDWNPTERTVISAFREKRFFGTGHRFNVSHRLPLSVIQYSDTKDVSILPNQFASVGLGTVFDLFRQICRQQLASQYSDAVQLEQAANACASNQLATSGISPSTQVTSGFLASSATVQRLQQLSLAIEGARNTLTFLFNRSESQAFLAAPAAFDDFTSNNLNNIRQHGVGINLSHKFSGLTNLNAMVSRQESTGSGGNNLKTTTTMYQASVSTQLGAKTRGMVTIRHSEYESDAYPYSENALIGSIAVNF